MASPTRQQQIARILAISETIREWEPFALEVFLTLSSLWAAVRMWFGGPVFLAASTIHYLGPNIGVWKFVVTIAGLAKLFGLTLCLRNINRSIGLMLRCIGLALSGVFWSVFGTLLLVLDPQAPISCVPLMLMGVSAWIALLRYPAMPSDRPNSRPK
jgi:hypothetical protein